MNAPSERRLAVGDGTFDPLRGELSLGGRTVRLRPRTAAFLAHLVQHGDRAVSKDELLRAIWPDAVVTEDSIVQCVKEIRQALGEAGRDWIRTIPRQGYAFVGNLPAQPTPQEAVVPPASPVASPAPSPWGRRGPLMAALLLVLVLGLVAVGFRQWSPGRPPAAPLSLVVLPVVNQTGDARNEPIADEMTESLTDSLSRMQGLVVISSRTAFGYKGKPVDLREVGSALNVRYVLEGTLRAGSPAPVLGVRLTEAATAVQLWGEDVRASGLEELQGLVKGRVAGMFGFQVTRAELQRERRHAPSPAAMQKVSEARSLMRDRTHGREERLAARALVEDALRLDPEAVDAWLVLAMTLLEDVRFSPTRETDLARAEQAARQLLARAPHSSASHFWAGLAHYENGRMREALLSWQHAIDLHPNDVHALSWKGAALMMLGRPAEAFAPLELAMRLSPRDPQLGTWHLIGGVAHLHLGHDAEAVEWLTRATYARPRTPMNHLFLAAALAQAGRLEEARASAAKVLALQPAFTISRFRAIEPSREPAFLAQRQRAYDGMRLAGLPE